MNEADRAKLRKLKKEIEKENERIDDMGMRYSPCTNEVLVILEKVLSILIGDKD